ncbi:hypothetical protein ACHWQZ_G017817 [Mnemiopsis leidyi]
MERVLLTSLFKKRATLAGLALLLTAGFLLSLTKSQPEDFSSFTLFLPHQPVPSYKLRLSYTGKCVGTSPDGRVCVMFCDPGEKQQYFQILPDGKLRFVGSGKCLQLGIGETRLVLGECGSGIRFQLVNSSYLQTMEEEVKCVSPIKAAQVGLVPSRDPVNRDPVTLTKCDKDASRIELIEKRSFEDSRRHLLLPLPPQGPTKCDFPACGINRELPPAKPLPTDQVTRCLNLSHCLTIITKTARRPQLVLRMVASLREVDAYRDITVVAYDDGGEEYSVEIMKKIAEFPNLQYIIGEETDLGISRGRNLALERVRTKYFMLLDDDNLISESSDLHLLAEILDTTDATLVGGAYKYNREFAGFLNFGVHSSGERALFASYGACKRTKDIIPNFPSCVRCELTSNAFMAKTRDIIDVGGWSDELKVMEHKDLFLRLKAEGKKVVYCPNFKVLNRHPDGKMQTQGYFLLRRKREGHMRVLFNNRWNIEKFPRF